MENNNAMSIQSPNTARSYWFGDFSSPNHDDSERSVNKMTYKLVSVCYPFPLYRQITIPHRYGVNTYNIRSCHWRLQFMPFNVVPEKSYGNEFENQDFHYFVVIDFEATCDKFKQPNPQEIIEFPSVLVNGLTGEVEDCFQTYVRPTHLPVLSDFCKELTGIQQTQVDNGVHLSTAIIMHDKWLRERGIKRTKFTIVTWTDCDCRTMLEAECKFKRIFKPSYFNRWINLKVAFQKVFGRVHCNLKEAVKLAGITWEGRAHSGLDDARNTAQLLVQLMRRGFMFSITSSIE